MKMRMLVLLLCMAVAGSASASLLDGLVGYWPMDEATGTTVADGSGYGNNGTVEGNLDRRAGVVGNALHFTSGLDHVIIPDADQYNAVNDGLTGITVTCWVKNDPTVDGTIGQFMAFVSKHTSGYVGWGLHAGLTLDYPTHMNWIPRGDWDAQYDQVAVLNDNTWHQLVGMTGPTESAVFYDGVEVGRWEIGIHANTVLPIVDLDTDEPLYIGALGGYLPTEFSSPNSTIDNVAIWNRSLTAAEVTELYNNDGLIPSWVAGLDTPAIGETSVAVDATLNWITGDETNSLSGTIASHEIWFGTDASTDPNGNFIGDFAYQTTVPVGTTSWDPFGATDMEHGTTYYWSITEIDSLGNTAVGSVWNFETIYPAVLTPLSSRVAVGDGLTLSVAPNATFVSYQYYLNDVAISGATSIDYTIASVDAADEGVYRCDVTLDTAQVASSNTAVVIVNRIVADLDLDGDYDDTSATDNDGAVVMSPDPNFVEATDIAFVADRPYGTGMSLQLNSNASIDLPNEGLYDNYEQMSVSCWVKPNYDPEYQGGFGYEAFVSKGGLLSGWYLGRYVASDQAAHRAHVAGAFTDVTGPETVNDGAWHKVTAVYEQGVRHSIYIDGGVSAQYVPTVNPLDNSDMPLRIGAMYISDDYYYLYSGLIADVKVYNYAITPIDIATDYYNETGQPACMTPPAFDTNDDCVFDLVDLVVYMNTWLDCGWVPAAACGN